MDSMEPRQRVKLTHADYLLFPDDGKRHELIDGAHFVTPSPRVNHQTAAQNLYLALALFVRERKLGRIFMAPMDVILSDFDVVEPDLLFVSSTNQGIVQDWIRGAPDLVVEVLSPTTRRRDETLKRDLYERRQIAEYWTVDPEAESVRLYRLSDGVYGEPTLLRAECGDRIETPLLPGLEVEVSRIFEQA